MTQVFSAQRLHRVGFKLIVLANYEIEKLTISFILDL